MMVLTKAEKIKTVASRWKEQYFREGRWLYNGGKDKIYKELIALENPTQEQIDKVIGNGSWTRIACDECKIDSDAVVIFDGDEYSYYLCERCLNLALIKIRSGNLK